VVDALHIYHITRIQVIHINTCNCVGMCGGPCGCRPYINIQSYSILRWNAATTAKLAGLLDTMWTCITTAMTDSATRHRLVQALTKGVYKREATLALNRHFGVTLQENTHVVQPHKKDTLMYLLYLRRASATPPRASRHIAQSKWMERLGPHGRGGGGGWGGSAC
jgi:hypothetical protein